MKNTEQHQRRGPRLPLIEARYARHLSQQEVADELGTTHVNVSRWERGITKPHPYFRRRLCRLFGKTETELDLLPQMWGAEINADQREAPPVLRLLLSNNKNGEEYTVLLAIEETGLKLKPIS